MHAEEEERPLHRTISAEAPRSRFSDRKREEGLQRFCKKNTWREGGRRTVMEKGMENTKTTFFSLSFSWLSDSHFHSACCFSPFPRRTKRRVEEPFFRGWRHA